MATRRKKPFQGFSLEGFWEDSDYAEKEYVEPPPTPALIDSIEARLGFALPQSYVALMRTQNGGIPVRTCFPTKKRTSWAADHIAITGFLSIGRTKQYSLLGALGSEFMQEEWGYPRFGFCICDCPSAGHDMVMFDFRKCGPKGEPSVVHVDQELNYRVTPLAPSFEAFVRGLVPAQNYDTTLSEAAENAASIEKGTFSSALARLLTPKTDATLRRLLLALLRDKGHFALHADPTSQLAYDFLFDVFTNSKTVRKPDDFLKAYPDLLAFGDGEISTGGYAPGFVADWLSERLASGAIENRKGKLVVSAAHLDAMRAKLSKL
jgi:hypothetical protein